MAPPETRMSIPTKPRRGQYPMIQGSRCNCIGCLESGKHDPERGYLVSAEYVAEMLRLRAMVRDIKQRLAEECDRQTLEDLY